MKKRIALMIARSGDCRYDDDSTYEGLLETIHENLYRTILKVPIQMFFVGIVQSFVTKGLEHDNQVLSIIKEVVREAFEVSGIELNFTDADWENCILIDPGNGYKTTRKVDGINGKAYMSEFFEI
jgi:hypothetical protein